MANNSLGIPSPDGFYISMSSPSVNVGFDKDFTLICRLDDDQLSPGIMSMTLSKTHDVESDEFK